MNKEKLLIETGITPALVPRHECLGASLLCQVTSSYLMVWKLKMIDRLISLLHQLLSWSAKDKKLMRGAWDISNPLGVIRARPDRPYLVISFLTYSSDYQVCLIPVHVEKVRKLSCGHMFCIDCWDQHFEVQVFITEALYQISASGSRVSSMMDHLSSLHYFCLFRSNKALHRRFSVWRVTAKSSLLKVIHGVAELSWMNVSRRMMMKKWLRMNFRFIFFSLLSPTLLQISSLISCLSRNCGKNTRNLLSAITSTVILTSDAARVRNRISRI